MLLMTAVVVIVLAFHSDDSSSNPTEVNRFSLKAFEQNGNKQKEVGVGPLKKLASNGQILNVIWT